MISPPQGFNPLDGVNRVLAIDFKLPNAEMKSQFGGFKSTIGKMKSTLGSLELQNGKMKFRNTEMKFNVGNRGL